MDLLELMRHRRSIRNYTQQNIPDETIEKILKAGLLSPSSKGVHPWEFIVVRDKGMLEYLSACRDGGHAKMLQGADCAVVVVADPEGSDVWVEDCSIAMSNMHLAAASLGIGSCWIQGRLRNVGDMSTETYLRKKLQFPDTYKLAAILSLGLPAKSPEPHSMEGLPTGKIHRETYGEVVGGGRFSR